MELVGYEDIETRNHEVLASLVVHRLIAEPSNREEVVKEINKFLDDHNYKSYYTQVCEDNGRLMIDVGSWSEFFYLEGMNFEEWVNGT